MIKRSSLFALSFAAMIVAAAPAYALDKMVTVTGEAMIAIAPDAAIIRIARSL